MKNTLPTEDEQNNIDTMYTSANYAVNYNRYGCVFGHCYVAAYSLIVDVAELISELDAGDWDASQAADMLAENEKQESLIVATGKSPVEAMQNLHNKVVTWWG